MIRIFINYRRQDSEGYVGRLYDHLLKHFEPENIFMDVASIDPGEDFVQVLDAAVAECDAFLAIIGSQWLTIKDDGGERRLEQWNDFVRIEIESALKQGKLVIPVLVGRTKMPSPTDLPESIAQLARRNAVELSHQRFAYDVENLVVAIKEALPANPSIKSNANSEIIQQKEAAIKTVRLDLIGAIDSPLYTFRDENRYFPVLGDGNPDANILFIGESPGKYEAEQGVPFCGPSGDVLDEMLGNIGLKRKDVYMTNVLLDRPPDNRTPTAEEITFYMPYVDRMIDIIEPAVIVSLGRFAMQYILKKFDLPEKREKIGQLHGKLLQATAPYGEIHIVPLYHPAVVLYSASQKDVLRKDFEKLKLFV
jgi:uracil-DNA glycosylase